MRQCGPCKGKGKIFLKGKWSFTDIMFGYNTKTCSKCGGSGRDPNWSSTSCRRCYKEIDYRNGSQRPEYCGDCKQKVRQEQQAQRQQQQRSSYNSSQPRYGQQNRSHSSSGGSSNRSPMLEKRCAGPGCYNYIKYKAEWSNPPQYCDTCKNKEFEKSCSVSGCENKIKYKVFYKDVSDKCFRCKKELERGSSPRSCDTCGKLMFVPRGKNYTTCRNCNERKQVDQHEALRRSVQGRRISTYASSMDQFARGLVSYINSSDDVFFVELGGEARKAWKMPPMARGATVDGGFDRGGLSYTFPTIDIWENGNATSIKSIDLGSQSYRNINALDRQIAHYVDQLAAYAGEAKREPNILGESIKERTLILVAPLIGARDYQLGYLYTVRNGYARSKRVRLVVFIVD